MPLSYQRYTGNGTTTDFVIGFQYLNKAHVVAKVNNSLVLHTWVNDSTLRISPAPATGSNVWIYRVTPKDAPLTVFKDGVGFREVDLNRMVKQLLYISQEAYENADLPLLAEWREETLLAMQQTVQARTEALGYRDQCLALVAEAQTVLDTYTATKITEINGAANTAIGTINNRANELDAHMMALQTAVEAMEATLGDVEALIPVIAEHRQAAEAAEIAAGLHEAGAKAYMEQAGSYRDGIQEIRNQTVVIRDETLTIRNATAQIRDDTSFIKTQTEAAKNAAEGFKDEAYTYLSQILARWNETKGFRDDAETYRNETAALASAVAEAAEAAFGATAGAWVEEHVYNWPDVVAAPDGHTYRCVGTNITSIPTSFNPEWQVLTVIPPVTFELDADGNLMPASIPVATGDWEIDADGNIMPRAS